MIAVTMIAAKNTIIGEVTPSNFRTPSYIKLIFFFLMLLNI
jgi:hypothetical protein